jgi:phospholipid/cholesterol/gamma-HCH transport system substrate-binding protein
MSSTAKVGLFALIVLFITAMFVLKIEDISVGKGKVQRIRVSFPDVSGLDAKAAVRVFGVRVGKVESIALLGDHAEAVLAVDASLTLGKGATASVRNMGLLGDKYVELVPGDPKLGPPENPAMLAGTSPVSYDEILAKISAIGENVKSLSASFKNSLSGPEAEAKIREIVENLRAATENANLLIAENRGAVKSAVGNIEEITARLKRDLPEVVAAARSFLENLDGVVLDNRSTLAEAVRNLKETTAKMETTMRSIDSIAAKIDEGKGTLGKLINSPETHDKLTATMDSIRGGVDTFQDSLGRVKKWDMMLDMHSDYLTETKDSLTDFSVWIWPSRGRFYLVELVSDPIGRRSEKTETITITNPDGSISTVERTALKYDQKYTVSALFGWRFNNLTLRAGIKQGTGGVGMDYRLFKERLKLSLDAFDFSDPLRDFQLLFRGKYYFHKNLYVSTGMNDIMNDDTRSFFIGGGITWKDEDFKYLLGAAPSL